MNLVKKIDLDLFFYYWIGYRYWYFDDLLLLFNDLLGVIERLDRVRLLRCFDLGVFVVNRVLLL